MFIMKAGQLNGVMINQKPGPDEHDELLDRVTDEVNVATGLTPDDPRSPERVWHLPGRTLTLAYDGDSLDLTIVRDGTTPFTRLNS